MTHLCQGAGQLVELHDLRCRHLGGQQVHPDDSAHQLQPAGAVDGVRVQQAHAAVLQAAQQQQRRIAQLQHILHSTPGVSRPAQVSTETCVRRV